MVESVSSLRSSGSLSIFGACSKIHFSNISDFKEFCSQPFCLTNSDFPSLCFSDLSANKMFDIPLLSFDTKIFLFVLNLSYIVLIHPSTLQFPLWSLTGQIPCAMNFSLKFLNVSLLNAAPGSVQILIGIPFSDTYSNKFRSFYRC